MSNQSENNSDGIKDSAQSSELWKLRRGEPRVTLQVPVTLEGKDKYGATFAEETVTENVSLQGACVETTHELEVGEVLLVSAFEQRFQAKARVAIVWSRKSVSNKFRVGLRFLEPNENWIIR